MTNVLFSGTHHGVVSWPFGSKQKFHNLLSLAAQIREKFLHFFSACVVLISEWPLETLRFADVCDEKDVLGAFKRFDNTIRLALRRRAAVPQRCTLVKLDLRPFFLSESLFLA